MSLLSPGSGGAGLRKKNHFLYNLYTLSEEMLKEVRLIGIQDYHLCIVNSLIVTLMITINKCRIRSGSHFMENRHDRFVFGVQYPLRVYVNENRL